MQLGCFDKKADSKEVSYEKLNAALRSTDRSKLKQAYCDAARVVRIVMHSQGLEAILRALTELKTGNRSFLNRLQSPGFK